MDDKEIVVDDDVLDNYELDNDISLNYDESDSRVAAAAAVLHVDS